MPGRCSRCGTPVVLPPRPPEEQREETLRCWLAELLDHQRISIQKAIELEHHALREDMQRELGQQKHSRNDVVAKAPPLERKTEASPPSPPLTSCAEDKEVQQQSRLPEGTALTATAEEEGEMPSSERTRPKTTSSKMEQIVTSHAFDLGVGFVIACNTISMFVQLQWEAWLVAFDLGLRPEEDGWTGAKTAFDFLEHVFNVTFLVELIVKLAVVRLKYFREYTNAFDCLIVVSTTLDAYILQPFEVSKGQNMGVARLVRIVRVVRIFRVFRAAKFLHDLRVLMRTLASSAVALFWSMLLLALIITGAGILMAQLLIEFVKDESQELELRLWIYRYYGGSARAAYTMFEVTFSGGWPMYARRLVEDVNALYGVFWVVYIVAVTFPVISIVRALFLKEAMQIAANDHDKMVLEKLKQKEAYATKLRKFFHDADTSGDGKISKQEFDEAMQNDNVLAYLSVLELEVYEVHALFNLLNDEDGEVSVEEFLQGALRLKGSARTVDSIVIMHEQHKIHKLVDRLGEGMQRLHKSMDTEWTIGSAGGGLANSEAMMKARTKGS